MTMRPANSEGCMSKPSEASDSPKHANGLGSLVNMNKVFNNTIKSTIMDTVEEVRFDSRLSNQRRSQPSSVDQGDESESNKEYLEKPNPQAKNATGARSS